MESNHRGLIVPRNNPKALAEAINRLTGNPAFAKTLGEAGYQIANDLLVSNTRYQGKP
jgi:hypothetical protein